MTAPTWTVDGVRIASVKEIELTISGSGFVPDATPVRLAADAWPSPPRDAGRAAAPTDPEARGGVARAAHRDGHLRRQRKGAHDLSTGTSPRPAARN